VDVVCPKCGTSAAPDEEACVRCGLRTSLWSSYRDEIPGHPPLDDEWPGLQAAWEDEVAHSRFIEIAARTDGLDVAAARYRSVLRSRPDDEIAKRAIARVAMLVERVHAERVHEAPSKAVPIVRALSWGVAVIFAGIATWVIYMATVGRSAQ
jgi:hypothetical protein